METLVINIPEKKSALVKQLLKELGVTIDKKKSIKKRNSIPNELTAETIANAKKGIGLSQPINNISDFIRSL